MEHNSRVPAGTDPLFPSPALMSLSDPGGVQNTLDHRPGPLRPYSATLGIPWLPEGKKHDTNASRWNENTPSQTSKDGNVVSDTVTDTKTDT